MEDRELSQAIIVYLAKGTSPYPRPDDDAVVAFAADIDADAEALVGNVHAIVEECMSIEIDWSTHSLVEGGREAQRVIAERHPEIGADALDALFWMFTYNWR